MAKYLINGATLTGLADKVRTLTGETDTLTPNAMDTQLDNANTEVNDQGDLLAQLEAAVGALPEAKSDPLLQEKSVIPKKQAQAITADEEYDGLSRVNIAAIPDEYQDITGVTAIAPHVLNGFIFVDANGNEVEGIMKHNGEMNKTVDGLTTTSVTIPEGYTSGGTVSLTEDIEEALAAI